MMTKYYYQVVFCSERDQRCYRMEISATDVNAMVTAVEMLPPGYDMAMERMRAPDEAVVRLGELSSWSGYGGCPFCGNRMVARCGCGYFSCMKSDHRGIHTCPKCRTVQEVVNAEYVEASRSGFIHGDRQRPLREVERDSWRRGGDSVPPAGGGPDRDKLDARDEVRRLLAERRLGIEDKRNRK